MSGPGSDAGSSEHELEELDRGFYHPHPPSPRHQRLLELRDGGQQVQNGKKSDSYKPVVSYARPTTKFDQDTTNSVTFKEHVQSDWAWCRAAPIKQKQCIDNLGSGGSSFEAESVMKNDFHQYNNPERATLQRPQAETQLEVGNFESNTSYKKDFNQKQIKVVHAVRPKEYNAPTTPFEGSSTATADFPPHPGHRRDPPFRPHVNLQPDKSTELECATTSSKAYDWPTARMEKSTWARQKAHSAPVQHTTENVYASSYQNDFIQPGPYKRTAMIKPVAQDMDMLYGPDATKPSQKTHYVEQFVAFSGKKPTKSCKLAKSYEPPGNRFLGESVYRANYHGDKVLQRRRSSEEAPLINELRRSHTSISNPERPASCPSKELLTATDEFGHIGFRDKQKQFIQRSPRRCKASKDIDPIFAATPESQKSDRERSSSRPPSAGKSPRSPSKPERPTSGRSSRPTTPRTTPRPTSARKETKTPPVGSSGQTSPKKATSRPTSATNHNALNASPTKKVDNSVKAKSDSVKKSAPKSANRNNSNANAEKAVSKPTAVVPHVDKKATEKSAVKPTENDAKKSAVPPSIRPPKKETVASAPKVTKPAVSSASAATNSATPVAKPAALPTPVPSATAPVPSTTTAPAKSTPRPAASDAKPVIKPVAKPAPTIASTPPMSTSAPDAPTTNTMSLLGDLGMPGPPTEVQPALIRPMVAATAAAPPPTQAPIRPPTLVAAPAAPTPRSMGADMDLSLLDTTSNDLVDMAEKNNLVEPSLGSPKMPVIAPPPAPAQPIVRMGNGPREVNLLN